MSAEWRVDWHDAEQGEDRFSNCDGAEGYARELAARLLADENATNVTLLFRGPGSARWEKVLP